jgi:hypothetical protein
MSLHILRYTSTFLQGDGKVTHMHKEKCRPQSRERKPGFSNSLHLVQKSQDANILGPTYLLTVLYGNKFAYHIDKFS